MFRCDFPVGNHTRQTLLSSHAYLQLFYYFFFKSVTFLNAFLAQGFSLVSKHSSLQIIFVTLDMSF